MELKQHLREGETEIVLVWSRVFVIVRVLCGFVFFFGP